jgi:hypothetical protein
MSNVEILRKLLVEEKELRQIRSESTRSIPYFLKDSERPTDKIKLQDFHKEWLYWLNNRKWAGIIAPRNHGKTELIAISYVIHLLGNNPNLRIKLFSNNDTNASSRIEAVKNYIAYDEDIHKLYPRLKPTDKWGNYKIIVERESRSKDGSFEAYGITSSSTGGRADVIILDDPVDLRNTIIMPELQPKIKSTYKNSILNLLEPQGQLVYIATPYTKDDMTADLRKAKFEDFLIHKINENLDAIISSSGAKFKLWKDKWSREALLERKEDIGSKAFGIAFQDRIDDRTETLFYHILKCINRNISKDDFTFDRFVMGADLAKSRKNTAAFTSLTVMGQTTTGLKVPVKIHRERMGSIATAIYIYYYYIHFGCESIRVETNVYQEALVEWIRLIQDVPDLLSIYEYVKDDIPYGKWLQMLPVLEKLYDMDLSIDSYVTGREKADPTIGLPKIATELEMKQWVIPLRNHDVDCQCGLCILIEEMLDYPYGKFKDTIMSTWFASSLLNVNRGSTSAIILI